MRNSFQIGKIFGISIRIDYTWFLIFAMVAWSLGMHYFPRMYASWSPTIYWIMGIITAIIFFISVLAHELAHSLVSKARGVPVNSITLFIFGGVAQISDEPKKPGSEFLMAIAGPITSLMIGAIFGLVYIAAGRARTPIIAMAGWLSGINISVGLFNLIPGFPLDGGRILRAVVWKITGSLRKATRIATGVGRLIAYLFILWGIWRVFSNDWVGGIWIAFIGWFLENAASSSYRQIEFREVLRGLKVKNVMVSNCIKLRKGLTIREMVDSYVLYTVQQCFPVVDDDIVIGIVTLQDIKGIPKDRWETTTIEQAMIPLENMKTISPEDDLFNVLLLMNADQVSQFPVVENNQLLGIVSKDNLINAINVRAELGER
ncbi:MAG: M50 family metallopeptidase [bacterium]